MTTVAYRDGILAADSCVTYTGEDDEGSHRMYQRKLQWRRIYPRRGEPQCIGIASRGDADAGAILDEMLLDEAHKFLSGRKRFCGLLDRALNTPALLKARQKVLGEEGKYEALMIYLWKDGDVPFSVGENAAVKRLDLAQHDYVAIGSDAGVALGAMYGGASAAVAVKASCVHGAWTGGAVHALGRGEDDYKLETI